MNSNILQAAQQYVNCGFNVIPIATDGQKKPIGGWGDYQKRKSTEYELQQWFGCSEYPCGIGIACGPISKNLFVIDFDHQAEETYPQWFAEVQQQLPEVAQQLFVIQTPRPGYHVWICCTSESELPTERVLAWTEPKQQEQAAVDADGRPKLEPQVKIEIRGKGHYVIAPGGPDTVHPICRPYQVFQGDLSTVPVLSADKIQQLLAIAQKHSRYEPQYVQRQPGQPYRGEPRPGDIYNQQADLLELLQQHDWQLHHTVDDVHHLTRPGKSITDGTSATLGALRSDDGKPLLYVFSSAAQPFEEKSTYDAFAAYALLEHGGDFSKAAAAVRIQYAIQVQAAQEQWAEEHKPAIAEYEPFPVHLLPEVVRNYVVGCAEAINVDAAFVAVPMLPVLAGLIGQTRRLEIQRGYTVPAILWSVIIADVATGKSPGLEAATSSVVKLNNEIYRNLKKAEQAWKEEVKATDKSRPKPDKPELSEQLVMQNFSMESLLDIHSKNWRGLLIVQDELAGWLRSFDQYRNGKGSDVQNWLSIHNGGSVQVNRKTDNYRICLESTAVSVCGSIQPSVAEQLLFCKDYMENGFSARFLSAMPPYKMVKRSGLVVSQNVIDSMDELTINLYKLVGEGGQHRSVCLPFEAEAEEMFTAYEHRTVDRIQGMERGIRNLLAKLKAVAARFALIFAVVKQVQQGLHGKNPVDVQSTQEGIALAEWFARELERNYTSILGMSTCSSENVLRWIIKNHPDGITARQLQQGKRDIQTADQAKQLIQHFLSEGKGRLDGDVFIPN